MTQDTEILLELDATTSCCTLAELVEANQDDPLEPGVYDALRALSVGKWLTLNLGCHGIATFKRVI